jgi:hypothetical protein
MIAKPRDFEAQNYGLKKKKANDLTIVVEFENGTIVCYLWLFST